LGRVLLLRGAGKKTLTRGDTDLSKSEGLLREGGTKEEEPSVPADRPRTQHSPLGLCATTRVRGGVETIKAGTSLLATRITFAESRKGGKDRQRAKQLRNTRLLQFNPTTWERDQRRSLPLSGGGKTTYRDPNTGCARRGWAKRNYPRQLVSQMLERIVEKVIPPLCVREKKKGMVS